MKTIKPLVAPSILSADFARLGEEVRDVARKGADIIHVDVMDGHFVPNLTIGPVVVKSLRPITKLPLDVHLMIESPWKYVGDFRKAGADWITIHTEAGRVRETLKLIKRSGAKAGISLRPRTPLARIRPYLKDVDLVLVMTVEPGFGGQSFMADQLPKIAALRKLYKGLISVDGGINGETGRSVAQCGADILVAGTAVFGHKDRRKAIRDLRAGHGRERISGY